MGNKKSKHLIDMQPLIELMNFDGRHYGTPIVTKGAERHIQERIREYESAKGRKAGAANKGRKGTLYKITERTCTPTKPKSFEAFLEKFAVDDDVMEVDYEQNKVVYYDTNGKLRECKFHNLRYTHYNKFK